SINQLLGVDDAEDDRGDRPQHHEQQQGGGDRVADVGVTAEVVEDEEVGQLGSGVGAAFGHDQRQLELLDGADETGDQQEQQHVLHLRDGDVHGLLSPVDAFELRGFVDALGDVEHRGDHDQGRGAQPEPGLIGSTEDIDQSIEQSAGVVVDDYEGDRGDHSGDHRGDVDADLEDRGDLAGHRGRQRGHEEGQDQTEGDGHQHELEATHDC